MQKQTRAIKAIVALMREKEPSNKECSVSGALRSGYTSYFMEVRYEKKIELFVLAAIGRTVCEGSVCQMGALFYRRTGVDIFTVWERDGVTIKSARKSLYADRGILIFYFMRFSGILK